MQIQTYVSISVNTCAYTYTKWGNSYGIEGQVFKPTDKQRFESGASRNQQREKAIQSVRGKKKFPRLLIA